jgi:hypothetical protein
MGELEAVASEEFARNVAAVPKPVGRCMNETYGLDLDPLKLELATQVADHLNHPDVVWWRDEQFLETDLGRFLQFVQGVF